MCGVGFRTWVLEGFFLRAVGKSFSLAPIGNVQLVRSHVLMLDSFSFSFASLDVEVYVGLCHSVGLVWLFLVVGHFYRVFTDGSYF